MQLARSGFDIGLLTNQPSAAMLSFWRDTLGLDVDTIIEPLAGVRQLRLNMHGAILKINCITTNLAPATANPGYHTLTLAHSKTLTPHHLTDPDGNRVILVPVGHQGINTFDMQLSISNCDATQRFFRDALQLKAIGENRYALGGASISFAFHQQLAQEQEQEQQQAGYHYLTIQVEDVELIHDAVCKRGAVEIKAPSDQHTTTQSIISFIADPDGNVIELSQKPALALRQ